MPNLVPLRAAARTLPAIVAAADGDARESFLEFFASNIRNRHTRRAYRTAVQDFLDWCEQAGVASFRDVRPLHVAAWVEQQTQTHKAPTAKLRVAAIRHLFDWLVNAQVVPVNPAASVRGPTHVVRKGQTPLLEPKEARKLLDSIDTSTEIGLRDRALLALMVYSFARVGAALAMRVEDVYTERRRLWVRLREKGGKAHVMPCHHNLENYLTAYLEKTGIADDPKGPLFRTIGRRTKKLTRTAVTFPANCRRSFPPICLICREHGRAVSAAGIRPQARAGPLSFAPASFREGQAAWPAGDRGRDIISDGSAVAQAISTFRSHGAGT